MDIRWENTVILLDARCVTYSLLLLMSAVRFSLYDEKSAKTSTVGNAETRLLSRGQLNNR